VVSMVSSASAARSAADGSAGRVTVREKGADGRSPASGSPGPGRKPQWRPAARPTRADA
jgi:hypothetical protein